VILAVIVAGPVIVDVHLNGNATVGVIETVQGSMRLVGMATTLSKSRSVDILLALDKTTDHAHGGVPVQVHVYDHGCGHDHGHGHGHGHARRV
jgi:hypothetical protein